MQEHRSQVYLLGSRTTSSVVNDQPAQNIPEAISWGIGASKAAIDIAMLASTSAARILQILFESANVGLSKYVELTEQELKRGNRRESVKVD
jgi:hypothetical protein